MGIGIIPNGLIPCWWISLSLFNFESTTKKSQYLRIFVKSNEIAETTLKIAEKMGNIHPFDQFGAHYTLAS